MYNTVWLRRIQLQGYPSALLRPGYSTPWIYLLISGGGSVNDLIRVRVCLFVLRVTFILSKFKKMEIIQMLKVIFITSKKIHQ